MVYMLSLKVFCSRSLNILFFSHLIPFQSSSTGLFSCNSEAYVRDSVYCSAAIWALALAYRRYVELYLKDLKQIFCWLKLLLTKLAYSLQGLTKKQ